MRIEPRRLSDADLGRLRRLIARDRSIEIYPNDYPAAERESHYLDYMIMMGNLAAMYQIEDGESVNPNTGAIASIEGYE